MKDRMNGKLSLQRQFRKCRREYQKRKKRASKAITLTLDFPVCFQNLPGINVTHNLYFWNLKVNNVEHYNILYHVLYFRNIVKLLGGF